MNTPPAKWIAAWFIAAILFLILSTCAKALTPAEREIVTQMKDTITDLRAKYEAQVIANDSALTSLSLAVIQTADLTTAAKAAQEQAAAMTAERDMLKDTVAAQEKTIALQKADKANLLASFHTFKFWTASIVAALIAAIAALLIFRFMAPALNTPAGLMLAFGLPAAAGAAVFTLIITR